jgi:large subunit ribosomal protein L7A
MSLEALKSSKKVIGAKQVAKAVEKGLAVRVFLAQDADTRVTTPIRQLCDNSGVAVEMVFSMDELGDVCGIDVGAAAVAQMKG